MPNRIVHVYWLTRLQYSTYFFLVLGSDDSFLVYTNTEFRMCVVTFQGMPLSSCLVLRASYTRALPCLLHCSTFVNVPSLLLQIDSVGFLDSNVLQASFSPACNLPGYYAELS